MNNAFGTRANELLHWYQKQRIKIEDRRGQQELTSFAVGYLTSTVERSNRNKIFISDEVIEDFKRSIISEVKYIRGR